MHENQPLGNIMKGKLYLESHSLQCMAEINECYHSENERYAVRLDRTLFHPQGGGQPCDKGTLNGHEVLHVAQDRDGKILHYLPVRLPLGPVHIQIDAQRRHLHARLHSAGHLIGHLVEKTGWKAIKAHHWPGESKVFFRNPNHALPPFKNELTAHCQEQIALRLPVLARMRPDGLREVSIGQLGHYPCGGTHVKDTSELNGLTIIRIQSKNKELIIHYEIKDC